MSNENDIGASSRILTLVFTDLADSTALKTQLGDRAVGELIARHRAHVIKLAADSGGRIIDWAGDGCFLTFAASSAAVLFALRLQQVHANEPDLPGVRTGVHMGEVSERPGPNGDLNQPRIEGLAVDLAARISGLARPGQILMSSAVANSARQRMDNDARLQPIRWQAHGSYTLKGFDEALEIREAGLEGVAPFLAPAASEKARLAHAAAARPGSVSGRKVVLLSLTAIFLLTASGVVFFATRSRNTASPNGTDPVGVTKTATKDASAIPSFEGRPAIAVLPFDNFSPDADQAFFADGLAEDLITRLSTWRAFPVIARNSSFKYRGGNLDLKSVSADLGARYLVEGSVRREGEQIRVTAQLIDASTGEHVWADKYDRNVTDVFAIQDEISATIAASLVSDLNRAEAERARSKGTENLEAWSLYQLGLRSYDRFTREGFVEAKQFFEQAIEKDPRFATALGELAMSHVWQIALGWSGDRDKTIAVALELSRRAVELDPRDSVAHGALSWAYIMNGDPHSALDYGSRAAELNPSDPWAWTYFGWAQLMAGDPEACIASSRRGVDLNPQGTMIALFDNLYWAYWEARLYNEALVTARRAIAQRSDYFPAFVCLAVISIEQDRLDDARAAIGQARRIQPDLSLELVQNYFGVSRPAVDERRNAALRRVGLE